jgi:hypothetical protein
MKSAVLTLVVLFPALALAREPQSSWDNLKQLQSGQKIEVVDSTMKSLHGAFVSVSDEAISLRVGKAEETVVRANVVRVSVRDTSHRTRNMLLGAGIAGGAALIPSAILLSQQSNEGNNCAACVAAIAAGFGGGAALGAIPGSKTIYRASK